MPPHSLLSPAGLEVGRHGPPGCSISILGWLGAEMVTTGDSCLCIYVNAKACRIRELRARFSYCYLESVSEIPGLRCPEETRSPSRLLWKDSVSSREILDSALLGILRGFLLVSNPKSALWLAGSPASEGSWCDSGVKVAGGGLQHHGQRPHPKARFPSRVPLPEGRIPGAVVTPFQPCNFTSQSA